jgi:hypothetical protein
MPEVEEQSILNKLRKKVHFEIRKRIGKIGWLDRADITEKVKQKAIWIFFNKESLRALDIIELKEALLKIEELDENFLLMCFQEYNSATALNERAARNYRRATEMQIKKIIKVGRYVIGMDNNGLNKYIKETTEERAKSIYQLTVNDADSVIKRLEQWETKSIRK